MRALRRGGGSCSSGRLHCCQTGAADSCSALCCQHSVPLMKDMSRKMKLGVCCAPIARRSKWLSPFSASKRIA